MEFVGSLAETAGPSMAAADLFHRQYQYIRWCILCWRHLYTSEIRAEDESSSSRVQPWTNWRTALLILWCIILTVEVSLFWKIYNVIFLRCLADDKCEGFVMDCFQLSWTSASWSAGAWLEWRDSNIQHVRPHEDAGIHRLASCMLCELPLFLHDWTGTS